MQSQVISNRETTSNAKHLIDYFCCFASGPDIRHIVHDVRFATSGHSHLLAPNSGDLSRSFGPWRRDRHRSRDKGVVSPKRLLAERNRPGLLVFLLLCGQAHSFLKRPFSISSPGSVRELDFDIVSFDLHPRAVGGIYMFVSVVVAVVIRAVVIIIASAPAGIVVAATVVAAARTGIVATARARSRTVAAGTRSRTATARTRSRAGATGTRSRAAAATRRRSAGWFEICTTSPGALDHGGARPRFREMAESSA